MNLKDKCVFLFSPESWGRNFVSKHHYAKELSDRGNTVYFFNPPTTSLICRITSLEEVSKQLFVVSYTIQRGLNALPRAVREIILGANAKRIQGYLKTAPDLVWSFDPFVFQDLKVFSSKKTIFFQADLTENPIDVKSLNKADLNLCTSEVISDSHPNSSFINVGHGVSEDFFIDLPREKSIQSSINVGYVGNLGSRFLDLETLKQCIELNPLLQFHFFGPDHLSNLAKANTTKLSDEIRFENCHFHGEVRKDILPEKIALIDIFLISYDAERFTERVSNPHKILEYLATGRPVVANYTQEYHDHKDLIHMAGQGSDLPGLLKRVASDLAIENEPERLLRRIEFARTRTYNKQVDRIESILKGIEETMVM